MEGKVTHSILGFFWHGGDEITAHLKKFFGEIEIAKDGKLTGYVKDSFGRADIKGEVKGARLEFTKEYDPDSTGGAKGKILYLLQAQAFGDAEKIVCGGWKGIYKIPADQTDFEEDCTGQTACMIYPR